MLQRDHSPKCVMYITSELFMNKVYINLFYMGFPSVVCGSWFDHFLSWEEHANDKNILFLFYEDMKKVNILSAFISECITCKLTSLKYQRANYNEKGERRKM